MRISNAIPPISNPRTPQSQNPAIRFGYVPPAHPKTTQTPQDSNPATNPQESLALKDAAVLMWAILVSLPTLAFGAYKISNWYARRAENRRMELAHAEMLANTETAHRHEHQAPIALETLHPPENAVIHEQRDR